MSPRRDLEWLFRAALAEVEGGAAVERALRRLEARSETASHAIGPTDRFRILAAGKASAAMVSGALGVLGERILGGWGVSRDEPEGWLGPVEIGRAGHPVPDARSLRAGERALRCAAAPGHDARWLVLLSGGASSLWSVPVPGVSLEDKARLGNALLEAGVPIESLNAVRKHLSRIKGGGLLRAAARPLLTLAISDVAQDRPDVIGSGPTVPDPTTFADALEVVTGAGLEALAPACTRYLHEGARGMQPETFAPSLSEGREAAAGFRVVAGIEAALTAVQRAAEQRGWRTYRVPGLLAGEARALAPELAAAARRARQGQFDLLVAGGEPTVHVRASGKGGRAQELALAFAREIDGEPGYVGLFAGTDGSDGPTDAAGAFVDATSVSRARAIGIDAMHALMQNDAYTFHAGIDELFVTGPTGTNVTDLALVRIVDAEFPFVSSTSGGEA